MSEAAKPLPRVIGKNCEFCGINAAACVHAPEFKAKGLLKDVATKAFIDRMRNCTKDAEGNLLPAIKADVCDFCGVSFLSEKCQHLSLRRIAVFGSDEVKDDTFVVVMDDDELLAHENAKKSLGKETEEGGAGPKSRASLAPELGGDKSPEEKSDVDSNDEPKAEGSEPEAVEDEAPSAEEGEGDSEDAGLAEEVGDAPVEAGEEAEVSGEDKE